VLQKHCLDAVRSNFDQNENKPQFRVSFHRSNLGLWMAIQSKVDYINQSKTIKAESLALTTKAAWDELLADIISKVFGKLPSIWTQMASSQVQRVA